MTTTPHKLLPIDSIAQEKAYWCWAAASQAVLGYLRRPDELHVKLGRGLVAKSDTPLPSQGQLMNLRRHDDKRHVDCSIMPGKDATIEEENEWYRVCNWGGWPELQEFSDLVESTIWASRRHVLEKSGLQVEKHGPRMRIEQELSYRELQALVRNSGEEFRGALDRAESCALSWRMLKQQIDDGSPVIFAWRYAGGGGHMMVATGYLSIPNKDDKTHDWVFVRDSWPPLSGDGYLVPYHYWVSGPAGRHWRDYWVPKTGSVSPFSLPWDDAFVASQESAADPISDEETKEPSTTKRWDLEELETILARAVGQAEPSAMEGLEALQEIVDGEDAREMAAALGLGVVWLKAIARFAANALASGSGIAGASEAFTAPVSDPLETTDVGRYLGDEDKPLEFYPGRERAIPVFEIRRDDLLDWDGKPERLPLAAEPTELVFPVRWPDQTPFDLFSTVTVRRMPNKKWQVVTIGRASMIQALGTSRWLEARAVQDPTRVFEDGVQKGIKRLKKFLEDVGLVEPASRQEGATQWLFGALVDLGLDKIVWEAMSSRIGDLVDAAVEAVRQLLGEHEDGEKIEVYEERSIRRWREALGGIAAWLQLDKAIPDYTDNEVTWDEIRPLLIGSSDEETESVLARLWPIALADSNALEERPEAPSEEDRENLRALAKAIDRLLDRFKPTFLAQQIKQNEKEAKPAVKASADWKELLEKVQKDADLNLDQTEVSGLVESANSRQEALEERLNALAQAAYDGWKILEEQARELMILKAGPKDLLGDLGKAVAIVKERRKNEGLVELETIEQYVEADSKVKKEYEKVLQKELTADTRVLDELCAALDAKERKKPKKLIEAVKSAWTFLVKEGHNRRPKASLESWNLPRYLINVPDFYQLFLVYEDERIVQAYHEQFYGRSYRVRASDRMDLFTQLRKLA